MRKIHKGGRGARQRYRRKAIAKLERRCSETEVTTCSTLGCRRQTTRHRFSHRCPVCSMKLRRMGSTWRHIPTMKELDALTLKAKQLLDGDSYKMAVRQLVHYEYVLAANLRNDRRAKPDRQVAGWWYCVMLNNQKKAPRPCRQLHYRMMLRLVAVWLTAQGNRWDTEFYHVTLARSVLKFATRPQKKFTGWEPIRTSVHLNGTARRKLGAQLDRVLKEMGLKLDTVRTINERQLPGDTLLEQLESLHF